PQLISQSIGVVRRGGCAGAIALPSGPISGAGPTPGPGCATTAGSAIDAPGGGSSGPLRPQPARPSAATSAPTTAIRVSVWQDEELNFGTPKAFPARGLPVRHPSRL